MSLLMVRKSAPAHAADAYIDDITYKYKVGDKIKTPDGVGIVQKKTHTNSGTPAYEVKLDKGGIVVHVEQSVSAADATDAPINDVKMAIASTGAKVISVRSDQPNWFTFTIEGKSVRSVSQIIDKVSRVARVRKNSPEMWNPVTDPKNFKLQLAFDAADDADKSEELEREIKGDVVAVVSGNAARVSKDVSFATAKEGVESFARKNGVSVVASQEYGEAYKFKFSAAIDCATDAVAGAAQDEFKNPRFIPSLTQDVSRLKEKYESALKEGKDNFAYWFKRKVLDEATYLKEIIVEAIATKETSPDEVAKLKPLKDECNKSIQKANAMLSKINSLN